MNEKDLSQWEQGRDLGQEILEGVKNIKEGKVGRQFISQVLRGCARA